jgi:hypothetical protein
MNWQTYVLLGVLAGLVLGFPLLARRMREYRLSQAGLDNLTQMLDEDMLMHMARLLGALGYRVYRPTWEDAGFELVLVDGLGQKRGVLVAHWRNAVDVPVVQQAVAAAARLGGTAPMIVTVEYYTWKARAEAAEAGVILWTLRELTQAIGARLRPRRWRRRARRATRPGMRWPRFWSRCRCGRRGPHPSRLKRRGRSPCPMRNPCPD